MKSTKKQPKETRNILTERSFLGLYLRIMLGLIAFWLFGYVVQECDRMEREKENRQHGQRTTVWKNLDPNRRPSEIQSYDYENFTVTYNPKEEPRTYTPNKKADSYIREPDLIDLNDVDPYDLIDYLDADLD